MHEGSDRSWDVFDPGPEDDHNDDSVQRINDGAAIELLEQAVEIAGKIREYVHDGISHFLDNDRELTAKLSVTPPAQGEVTEWYILEDMLAAPTQDGQFQRCFSMKVIDPDGSPEEGNDELVVYIPVPEGITLDEGVLPLPPRVYVEHADINGEDKTRYEIGGNLRAYSAAADDGQEVTDVDLMSDEQTNEDRRLKSGAPALAAILENLINMKAVPQRKIIEGDPKVYDL